MNTYQALNNASGSLDLRKRFICRPILHSKLPFMFNMKIALRAFWAANLPIVELFYQGRGL
jgi:hypothetical protein